MDLGAGVVLFFFANPGRDANGEESIEDDFSVQVAGQ